MEMIVNKTYVKIQPRFLIETEYFDASFPVKANFIFMSRSVSFVVNLNSLMIFATKTFAASIVYLFPMQFLCPCKQILSF